jgi:1-acyl-sn-glycerol-3-phosphate acyltransferase
MRMGLRDQLEWIRSEWGIFARRDDMSLAEVMRWLSQWVPFGARTIAYGTVSLTLGPLTPNRSASTWAMRRWSQASLRSLGIDLVVEGASNVPEGGLMYASNHQSLLDILVLGAALPGDLKWAAKRSLMKIPFLGWHLALSGHVPVERKAGKRAAAEAIVRFEQVMRAGKQLLVFPEGTRSADGGVQPFKNGGFYAAARAALPVVPVALHGTHRLMRKHASDTGDVAPGRVVRVAIGAPIYPAREGKERVVVEDLRDRVHASVVALHGALSADRERAGAGKSSAQDARANPF